ncbi:MAG: CoA transferase, partial [Dehalococcoidia bacterium]|nr:CoA transferase [Dehalococcoidia bacterium]
MAEAAIPRALTGIRVLDFGSVYAVPYATMLLGTLGAEVIKVESRSRVDISRSLRMSDRASGAMANRSHNYDDVNLGKLDVTLNLKEPKAIELARRLVAVSDVVVDSFRPTVMDRLGLGYEDLRQIRPDTIVLSLSSSGTTGPERNHGGYAGTFAAMGGLFEVTGYPDGIPTEIRGTIDLRTGTMVAFAILAALNHRQRTGEGQFIDYAAREGITTLIGDLLMGYVMNGKNPERVGNRDNAMAPHNLYPCQGDNRWVSIAVSTDDEWRALCRVMGQPEWATDERFAGRLSRWTHQDELDKLIAGWTRLHMQKEAVEMLQQAGIAATPSMSSEDLYKDPHLQERQFWIKVNHQELGERHTLGLPWKLSRTPVTIDRASPLMGQHN